MTTMTSERPYQISCMGHRNSTPRCCFCRVGYICAATDCISADTKRRAVPLRQPSLLCTCSAAVLSSAAVEITRTVSHLYTFLVHVTAHLPPPPDVLFFSRPRSEGWPHRAWTYFLHLSMSSVILTESSAGSPVHVLMLSIQAVRGLPRLRAPGIVLGIVSLSRQLPCFLVV